MVEKHLGLNKKIANQQSYRWEVNESKRLARKRVKPNELIKKATYNLNNTRSAKYGFSPEQIEKKSLGPTDGKNFRETYDFSRLWMINEAQGRADRYAEKLDSGKKRKLRSPLDIGG